MSNRFWRVLVLALGLALCACGGAFCQDEQGDDSQGDDSQGDLKRVLAPEPALVLALAVAAGVLVQRGRSRTTS